ncbi:phenylacetate--CoA ligase [Thermococci archaeon]|nr:MAG: phenylacetate--CoA ligase [Thermococci archaeon]RLF93819.1 MAG: phenylacetate--CoA ligase [Thermococci archaeon]
MFWSKEESMDRKELEKLQLRRLKWTISHAYSNNEIYHRKMEEAGVKPGDVKSLDDIRKLPFLSKAELRDYYPFGLVSVPMDEIVEIHASSGTTGKPVVGTYTQRDLEIWTEVMARCLWADGIRKGDRIQNAYGYGLFTGAHGFERGARAIGAMVIPTSSGNTKRQIQIMKDFETTALACTPSYALYMAEVAEKEGYNPGEDFSLRVGLFGAEAWSEEIRKKIEEKWNIDARDHYGLTEVIGPGVSFECEAKDGLHVNSDHFLMEIIDPETGEQVGEGEKGELVFTSLTKEAFPVIRFRTRDLVYSMEECECGRTFPKHSRIIGRADDMMKVKGVIVFPSQIEEAIVSVRGASENYQIVKYKRGPFTEIKVRVEPTAERFSKGNLDDLKREIEEEIQKIVGLRVEVEIASPGEIPRSEGKAKRIVEG